MSTTARRSCPQPPAAHLFPLDSFGSAPFRRERSERAESPSHKSRLRRHRPAIRLAVSLGGDSDTLACITGGIAEAYYKEIPEEIVKEMWSRLPRTFREILREMKGRFGGTLGDL